MAIGVAGWPAQVGCRQARRTGALANRVAQGSPFLRTDLPKGERMRSVQLARHARSTRHSSTRIWTRGRDRDVYSRAHRGPEEGAGRLSYADFALATGERVTHRVRSIADPAGGRTIQSLHHRRYCSSSSPNVTGNARGPLSLLTAVCSSGASLFGLGTLPVSQHRFLPPTAGCAGPGRRQQARDRQLARGRQRRRADPIDLRPDLRLR